MLIGVKEKKKTWGGCWENVETVYWFVEAQLDGAEEEKGRLVKGNLGEGVREC